MNKKARRAALRSALSMLFKDKKLTVVNSFELGENIHSGICRCSQ